MARVAPPITLNRVTETTLKHLVRSPSTPQGLALRSRIVLAAAQGQANQSIAAALHVPEVTVGKWRRSFAAAGLDGLEDAARSGRPPKRGPEILRKVQTSISFQ
jgi:transposase